MSVIEDSDLLDSAIDGRMQEAPEVQPPPDGMGSGTRPTDFEAQLKMFDTVSRFLPVGDEDQAFWWNVTGRHIGRMMHEARYSEQRQVELLLFHRFMVVPRLGARPTRPQPQFHSRVAPGVGDGSPIGYSWRWGTGPDSKPLIRHYIEPIGPMTGTAADPLNEIAPKEMLWELGKTLAEADLSLMWKFSRHIRPDLADEESRKMAGSSMLVGAQWAPDSTKIDVMAGLMTRSPSKVDVMLSDVFPSAMRDAYGPDVSLHCLDIVRDFMAAPHGQYLTVLGTTAIDCCSPEVSRFKIYVTTRNTSFDHVVTVMTLDGRISASEQAIDQMRDLWYGLKSPEVEFDASVESSRRDLDDDMGRNDDIAANANVSGVTFYFDIHPKYLVPHVKLQIDVSKHAKNDMAAIEAVTRVLRNRGQGRDADAYLNVVRGMVSEEELTTRHGFQAFFAFAFKNDDIDITSYFLPQVYRRFHQTQEEASCPR